MAGITFTSAAAFPKAERAKVSNEYAGLVKEMIETGEARSAVLPAGSAAELKAVDTVVYAVQAAGREAGVSIRKHVSPVDSKGKVTVTFIAREKITRTRVR